MGLFLACSPYVAEAHAFAPTYVANLHTTFQQKPQGQPKSAPASDPKEIASEKTPLKAIFQNVLDWLYAPAEKTESQAAQQAATKTARKQ